MKGGEGRTGDTRKEPECNMPVLVGEECASKTLQSCVLVKDEDDRTFCRKDTRVGEKLVTMETPEYGQKGIRASPSQKVAQLRCIYTNARSMGNKQEELEATVLVGNYNVAAITETWWDDSHDWSVAVDGYKLFRRDRRGRRGGGVALYVRKWIDCEELCLRNSHDQVESLWVKIKDLSSKVYLVVGVCYRPPDQGESVDEAFLLQLQELSCSQALILMEDFNHPDICWGSGTAGSRQSRRFLEFVEDNFLVQVIDGPTRGEALLDQVLANVEESIREVKTGGCLGFSDHALVEFVILRNMGLAKSRVRTLNLRTANFWLLKELLAGIPWETVLE
ncbi:uncharacterized protein LOC118159406, partial [Oxyura jamaicensis]|uniref:uncharacterized protein LOC118159406 n=1 Tax=Oxyura jamaicensis TaxID=8884 RepID=UPI0015A5C2A9